MLCDDRYDQILLYALDFYNSGPNKSKLHFVINKESV